MNICFAANDNYAMQTGVALLSILEHNKNQHIDCYVVQNDFTPLNLQYFNQFSKNYDVDIYMIDPTGLFTKLEALEFVNKMQSNKGKEFVQKTGVAVYTRMFLSELLPKNVRKVLYIDSDVIVCGNLNKLYSLELSTGIGAVIDVWPTEYNKWIGLSEKDNYYSSGIQLLDLEIIRKEHLQEKIWDYMKKMKYQYRLVDQDVLNILFHDIITKLPLEYNLMGPNRYFSIDLVWRLTGKTTDNYYTDEEQFFALNNPIIFHYAGDLFGKPWLYPFINKYNRKWYSYYKKSPWSDQCIAKYIEIDSKTYIFQNIKMTLRKAVMFMKGSNKVYVSFIEALRKDAIEL